MFRWLLLLLALTDVSVFAQDAKKGQCPYMAASPQPTTENPFLFMQVCMMDGTERAWTGKYLASSGMMGTYTCSCCGSELYHTDHKYDSKTGWPSFYEAHSNVGYRIDYKGFEPRVEIYCKVCGAHLGHIFFDGPAPTGERHCVNSVCMNFEPSGPSNFARTNPAPSLQQLQMFGGDSENMPPRNNMMGMANGMGMGMMGMGPSPLAASNMMAAPSSNMMAAPSSNMMAPSGSNSRVDWLRPSTNDNSVSMSTSTTTSNLLSSPPRTYGPVGNGCPPASGCRMYCENGFVKDESGCNLCKCAAAPSTSNTIQSRPAQAVPASYLRPATFTSQPSAATTPGPIPASRPSVQYASRPTYSSFRPSSAWRDYISSSNFPISSNSYRSSSRDTYVPSYFSPSPSLTSWNTPLATSYRSSFDFSY